MVVFKSSSKAASVGAIIVVVLATSNTLIEASNRPPLPPITASDLDLANAPVKWVEALEDDDVPKWVVRCVVMLRMRFDGTLEAGMEEDAAAEGADEVLDSVVKTEGGGGVVGGVVGEMAAMVVEEEVFGVVVVVDMMEVCCCCC